MADNRLPNLIWLHPNLNCAINSSSAKLRVNDISGVGIGVRKVISQSISQLRDTHKKSYWLNKVAANRFDCNSDSSSVIGDGICPISHLRITPQAAKSWPKIFAIP
jgi:hypothetical protein